MTAPRHSSKGLSVIEILILLALSALLITLAFPGWQRSRSPSQSSPASSSSSAPASS
jgi:Tfp pilus assembly protein FimT